MLLMLLCPEFSFQVVQTFLSFTALHVPVLEIVMDSVIIQNTMVLRVRDENEPIITDSFKCKQAVNKAECRQLCFAFQTCTSSRVNALYELLFKENIYSRTDWNLWSYGCVYDVLRPPPHFLLFTVPVVKATWEKDAEFLEFYSDVTDASIPTVSLGVANTERGDLEQSPSLLSYWKTRQRHWCTFKMLLQFSDRTWTFCLALSTRTSQGQQFTDITEWTAGFN